MNNIYSDSNNAMDSISHDGSELLSRMDCIESKIQKIRKKKKKGKGGNKKQLKKRLKMLEQEHTQLKYAIQVFLTQQAPAQSSWWQNAFQMALPKLVDFATAVYNNKPRAQSPSIQVLPTNMVPTNVIPANTLPQAVYLTDKNQRR